MLFNSVEFAIFLPVVFALYWALFRRNLRLQNGFILAASYFFYGWWDWRFLSLIIFSSIVDYLVGLGLGNYRNPWTRKLLLSISITVNIGFLGFFKYFNFFAENFAQAFSLFGQQIEVDRLSIVLPVGISFYTFQTLSYSIDVYRKRLEPTRDLIAFFSFVSFFPQLVAGPIERATNLLPQFYRNRDFDRSKATDGLRQILWGLFKKMVVADNCAFYVNNIYGSAEDQSGSTLFLATFLFAFQIYGDFSGYSDIAIGSARLFGFNLMKNFAFPYFSRDIAEFWRRWHISLSTWFRDYLYIPLGGSKGGKARVIINVFIIFLVSGFWHGANWTFIFWGLINAIYFIPLLLLGRNRENLGIASPGRVLPTLGDWLNICITFGLTMAAWIFFRAESITDGFAILGRIISTSLISFPDHFSFRVLGFITILVIAEWLQREREHALQLDESKLPKFLRWAIYYLLLFSVLGLGGLQQEFIYFRF